MAHHPTAHKSTSASASAPKNGTTATATPAAKPVGDFVDDKTATTQSAPIAPPTAPTRRARKASAVLPVARAREVQIAKVQKVLLALAKRASKHATRTSNDVHPLNADGPAEMLARAASAAWKDVAFNVQQANLALSTAYASLKTIPDTWAPAGRSSAASAGRGESFVVGATVRIKSDPKVAGKYADVMSAEAIAAVMTVTKTTKSKVVAKLADGSSQFFPRVHLTNMTSAK